LFTPDVIEIVHSRSGGVPRLINRICDRALQHGHRQHATVVDRAIVEATLAEIGPTTFAPTWSAIMSAMAADSAASDRSVACDRAASVEEEFTQELDRWLRQDLRPATRKPAAINEFAAEPAETEADSSASPRLASRRKPRALSFWRDRSRERRNETYIQRLGRVWSKRAAIAAVLYVAFKAAALGAATLTTTFGSLLLDSADLPDIAASPAVAVPPLATPVIAVEEQPRSIVAREPAAEGRFVVAVGVFLNPGGADRLVRELAAAGLPAAQRPIHLRARRMQQVVLGPFATRDDALDGLGRLQQLGGHDDARVVADAGDDSTRVNRRAHPAAQSTTSPAVW
jgi:hypothetical protein